MIREIKYRAWDKKMNEMITSGIELDLRMLSSCLPPSMTDVIGFIPENEGRRFEMMQFTGLKDKKGKEIWEGDIVKWIYPDVDDDYYKNKAKFGSIFGIIYWNNEDCSFSIKQISIGSVKFDKNNVHEVEWNLEFYDYDGREFEWNELEVVGNIYENKAFYENELEKYKLSKIEE